MMPAKLVSCVKSNGYWCNRTTTVVSVVTVLKLTGLTANTSRSV